MATHYGHAATVYRWVDEAGVIHITTEKPPAGVRAERLDLPTAKQEPGFADQLGRDAGESPGCLARACRRARRGARLVQEP